MAASKKVGVVAVIAVVLLASLYVWWNLNRSSIYVGTTEDPAYVGWTKDPALACQRELVGPSGKEVDRRAVVWLQKEGIGEAIYGKGTGVPFPRRITDPEVDVCNPSLVAIDGGYFLAWQSVGGGEVHLRGVALTEDLDPVSDPIEILPRTDDEIAMTVRREGSPHRDHGAEDYQMDADCSVYDTYDLAYCEFGVEVVVEGKVEIELVKTLNVVWVAPYSPDGWQYHDHIVARAIGLADPDVPDLGLADVVTRGSETRVRQARIAASSSCDLIVAWIANTMVSSTVDPDDNDNQWLFWKALPADALLDVEALEGSVYGPSHNSEILGTSLENRRLAVAAGSDTAGEHVLLVWDVYDPDGGHGSIAGMLLPTHGNPEAAVEFEIVAEYDLSDLAYRLPLMLANRSTASSIVDTEATREAFMLAYYVPDGASQSVLHTVLIYPDGSVGPSVRRAPPVGSDQAIGAGEMDAYEAFHVAYETGSCDASSSAFVVGTVRTDTDTY